MPDNSNLSDLYNTKNLTKDAFTTAVAAFAADPAPRPYEIAPGITLDIAAAAARRFPCSSRLEPTAAAVGSRRLAYFALGPFV